MSSSSSSTPTTTQKAVVYHEHGPSSVLKLEDIPIKEPAEGEVQVRIHFAGVNPADFKLRAGYWNSYPHKFPIVPGWDLSGVVTKVGHAARRFRVGDEVYSYMRRPTLGLEGGSYCQFATLPEAYLSPKPKSLSLKDASGVPLAALTAYQGLLNSLKFTEGQTIVVLGASGGVGSFAVQFARVFKAKHIIGVASTKNHAYLKKLGCTETIDYKSDIGAEVLKVLPGGADVVYDCFGGEGLQKTEDYTKEGGIVVSIAGAAKFTKNVTFTGMLVEPHSTNLEHIGRLIDDGAVSVLVEKVFPLSEAAKSHDEIATFHTTGKIVLDCQ